MEGVPCRKSWKRHGIHLGCQGQSTRCRHYRCQNYLSSPPPPCRRRAQRPHRRTRGRLSGWTRWTLACSAVEATTGSFYTAATGKSELHLVPLPFICGYRQAAGAEAARRTMVAPTVTWPRHPSDCPTLRESASAACAAVDIGHRSICCVDIEIAMAPRSSRHCFPHCPGVNAGGETV